MANKIIFCGLFYLITINAREASVCTQALLKVDANVLKESRIYNNPISIYNIDKRVNLTAQATGFKGLDMKKSTIYECDSLCIISPLQDSVAKIHKKGWYINNTNNEDHIGYINPEFITTNSYIWDFSHNPDIVNIDFMVTYPSSAWINTSKGKSFNFSFNRKSNKYTVDHFGAQKSGTCKKVLSNPISDFRKYILRDAHRSFISQDENSNERRLKYFLDSSYKSFYVVDENKVMSDEIELLNLSNGDKKSIHISEMENFISTSHLELKKIDYKNNQFLRLLKTTSDKSFQCVDMNNSSLVKTIHKFNLFQIKFENKVTSDIKNEFNQLSQPEVFYKGVGRLKFDNNSFWEVIEKRDQSNYTSYFTLSRKESKIQLQSEILFSLVFDRKSSDREALTSVLLLKVENYFCKKNLHIKGAQ
jgi:hypothetical protein